MTNAQIAAVFEQLADLLEFQGADGFRTRAYRNGARIIRNLSESVVSILDADDRKLTDIEGIGKGIAEKCAVLVSEGSLPQHQKLLGQFPSSVVEMLRVPGLGPKKAAVLFNDLGLKSLDELRAACEAGEVRELKGFGERTEKMILEGIDLAADANQRIYWSEADALVARLRDHMQACAAVKRLEFAGSYRRGRETVGDLDLLVESTKAGSVMDHFEQFADVADVIVRGGTKMSVRTHTGLQIDLRVVPKKSFGAALQYFTGSKEHNVQLRGRARAAGLKINEYGVFRVDGDAETYIAGASEEDVYATLELPVFPPELRENRGEYQLAEAGSLQPLIIETDIVGDLHMHTTATDGKGTIAEMRDAAEDRGLKYIAITDHSQRWMGSGMDAEKLRAQWAEIDDLNNDGHEVLLLKGVECDLLEQGGLDLDESILAEADWVLASIHYGQQQSQEKIHSRMTAALRSPHVHAIAHPTGRLINRREAYAIDVDWLIREAKTHGKVLELNANPARLDLHDVYCLAAKEEGVPIVINTDAHAPAKLAVLRYGILQARRGGLTKNDVLNTQPWDNVARYFN